MIAGATTTTVTTATTTTAATTSVESMAALGIVVVLLLIAALITKELSSGSDRPAAQRLAHWVNVFVAPLAIACAVVMGTKVWAILG